MWSPTASAFAFMATIAANYEPLRVSLYDKIPQNIGGVGGVGGLSNLLSSGDKRCDQSPYNNNSTYHNNYCYEKGSVGPFTSFAFIMLLVWVGPILLAAILTTLYNYSDMTGDNNIDSSFTPFKLLSAVWIGLNVLWFVLPLSRFWFSFTTDVEGDLLLLRMLAISLAAAHPLSWNLMVAAIPASGITSKLLACERKIMFECHRFVSYFTVGWGLLHGVFELVYLIFTKSTRTGHRMIVDDLLLRHDGEDLIFVVGLLALILLLAQGMVGYGRKVLHTSGWSFRKIHRALAFSLLLTAAAHWWPFFIFLIPAISLHAVGIACYIMNMNGNDINKSLSSLPNITRAEAAIMVILSIISSFFSTFTIWTVREHFMLSSAANLSTPFIFPALCIGISLLTSTLVSTLYLVVHNVRNDISTYQGLSVPLGENSPLVEIANNEQVL